MISIDVDVDIEARPEQVWAYVGAWLARPSGCRPAEDRRSSGALN